MGDILAKELYLVALDVDILSEGTGESAEILPQLDAWVGENLVRHVFFGVAVLRQVAGLVAVHVGLAALVARILLHVNMSL